MFIWNIMMLKSPLFKEESSGLSYDTSSGDSDLNVNNFHQDHIGVYMDINTEWRIFQN